MKNLYLYQEGLVTLVATPNTGIDAVKDKVVQLENVWAEDQYRANTDLFVVAESDANAIEVAEDPERFPDNCFYPDSYGCLIVAKKA